MSNNILVTGTPRSGTTLTCHLLNRLPDVVALHEPMRPKDLVGLQGRDEICRVVERFCVEQRVSIHTRKRAISKNVGGIVPDNPVGVHRSNAGLRQRLASKGEIVVDKELSQDFTLVIKHNAGFTVLLEGLVESFPVYAIVRNPLATLASWSSVEFGVHRGHVPAAEKIDPELRAKLAAINDDLDRQIYLLSWFHGQYHRCLPERCIIRYESIVESNGRALSVVQRGAEDFDEPLQSGNKSSMYDVGNMLRIGTRLLESEGAYWDSYTKDSVERLLNEMEVSGGDRPPNSRSAAAPGVDGPRTGQRRAEGPKSAQRAVFRDQKVLPKRRPKRESLLRQMPKGGMCAEVGVWEGELSAKILEIAEPRLLHLIDPWKHEPDSAYRNALYGGRAKGGQRQLDAVYERVTERFANQIQDGTVAVHRAPSAEAVRAFKDEYFDWVYIDANHLYEFVAADLKLWYPKVKRGGYLAGADYVEGRWWKGGVKKAVDEFCTQNGCELDTVGRQFVITVR